MLLSIFNIKSDEALRLIIEYRKNNMLNEIFVSFYNGVTISSTVLGAEQHSARHET